MQSPLPSTGRGAMDSDAFVVDDVVEEDSCGAIMLQREDGWIDRSNCRRDKANAVV